MTARGRATRHYGPVKRVIEVVGAVIVRDGLVLCVQRGPDGSLPGMWEFPGGKIEPGETAQAALAREISEELMCRVEIGQEVTTTNHEYDFGIVNLTTFYCELSEGTPRLVEHAAMTWRRPNELHELEWAPADIPAIDLIQARMATLKPG